jgi:hypothetical protein
LGVKQSFIFFSAGIPFPHSSPFFPFSPIAGAPKDHGDSWAVRRFYLRFEQKATLIAVRWRLKALGAIIAEHRTLEDHSPRVRGTILATNRSETEDLRGGILANGAVVLSGGVHGIFIPQI